MQPVADGLSQHLLPADDEGELESGRVGSADAVNPGNRDAHLDRALLKPVLVLLTHLPTWLHNMQQNTSR